MLQRRIWWAFVLVLAVGIGISVSIVILGDKVQAINRIFIAEKLPQSRSLGELRGAIGDQERVLYEYYSFTATKASFQSQLASNNQHLAKILAELDKDKSAAQQVQQLRVQLGALDDLSEKLATILGAADIDWDGARVILALVKLKVREIEGTLGNIATANQTAVDKLSEDSQNIVGMMVNWTVGFSVFVFCVSFFVGYYVVAILREGLERRRLSMFPERDPNVVLRLSQSGDILYANPSTFHLLAELQLDTKDARNLLPADFCKKLDETASSPISNSQFEQARGQHTFEYTVSYLNDFSEFHVYVKDVTARKRAEAKLVYQAFFDEETGLPNQYKLQQELTIALSNKHSGTLLMIVADHEQEIFETYGAAITANWLAKIAQRLSTVSQQSELTLYRFSNNAFIAVIESDVLHVAQERAQQFLSASEQPLQVDGYELLSTLSIGAAVLHYDDAHAPDVVAEDTVKQAANACNRIRSSGGNGIGLYDEAMGKAAAHYLSLSTDLKYAVQNNELRLHYQPKVEAATGRLVGMEALVRWMHPKRGMISPAEFIPIAEDTGLIVEIGRWVLHEACRQNAAWQRDGLRALRVAVNLSARQFRSTNLLSEIDAAIAQTGLPVNALELEITESMVMDDPDTLIELLNAIRQRGIYLALDDFGTGHSSLSYLKRFPIDCIKIDRAFIKDLPDNLDDVAIVKTIVAMAKALDMSTVAEGVETAEQLALLNTIDCDQIQGFFFSRPLAADDFLAFYRKHN
ncbi:putative bifunctional diguanylate cyclase/phosphodiesterase [Sapientia aquatica]|uniref:GGDEF domain-containing protein n=1 Tax=Sapientia aquatica TaxID=1549640 RepID=A0A4R5W1H1_9BURK|nr:bifunctional diguanylate cyclase/phosphodiesterase [Sapientia aquatica]TDK66016.1 GGDEF domain-containing protein [Sapientia aquatica]